MKIVSQSAMVESVVDGESILALIERAGRTCYKSEERIGPGTAAKFVKSIMDRGHDSVLEHASISVRVICDRGVSHEIVRHRIASYSQESTRYCNYGKADEITVIEPPGLDAAARDLWIVAAQVAEDSYLKMLKAGCTPQIARSVLPTCLKTEIVMTANLREWRHFFRLRTAKTAHPQMREVSSIILVILKRSVPVVFDDIAPE